VKLNYFDSDLATTTDVSDEGDVLGTSIQKLLKRAGGKIDILKMDCEGEEWALLEDVDSFQNIRSLTMEYHFWALPGMDKDKLKELFDNINFKITAHTVLSPDQGIIIAINKAV
jgi:hypothetical protein